MASIYDANTNYQVSGVDLQANPGFVTREYLIDVYPSLIDNFRFAGLWTWGYNNEGNLGDGVSTSPRSSPIQTIAGSTNWKQVSALGTHTLATKTDGTLWVWGSNSDGRLGDNSQIHRSSPTQVGANINWQAVSSGFNFSAAIKTDNTLWTWGSNVTGQLGVNTTVSRSSPTQVGANTNWKAVSTSAASGFALSIKTDSTLWSWGTNTNGNLGDNTTTHRSSPVQITGTTWKQISASDAAAAIKSDNTLWVWGYNEFGNLGDNTTTHRSSPVQITGTTWKQISVGGYNTAAIKTDGTLWSWGAGTGGGVGDSAEINRSSPVQIPGTNWKQISVGRYNTAAIKTDGTLWAWGDNTRGQLGDNSINYRSSPVQTVSGGTNWKQVSAGTYGTSAIRDDSSDPFRSNPL